MEIKPKLTQKLIPNPTQNKTQQKTHLEDPNQPKTQTVVAMECLLPLPCERK